MAITQRQTEDGLDRRITELTNVRVTEDSALVYEPFVPMGIGPSSTVDSMILLGMEINPTAGPTIPLFIKHYRNQGFM